MATQEETTITCLLHALTDSQGTIRAYDMKANSLGVLLTVAVGVTNFNLLNSVTSASKWLIVSTWVFGLVALVLCALTLYPLKNPIFKVVTGSYQPSRAYFVTGSGASFGHSADSLHSIALSTDWPRELAFEHLKLAAIREYKHGMFGWSLVSSGATFMLIVVAIVYHTIG